MPYNVSSWFVEQLEARTSQPKRVFTIGGSDYSQFVRTWPTIRRDWDSVRPQSISINLANESQALNYFQTNKINLSAECTLQIGFTHPESGDELITQFGGKVDKVRYRDAQCTIVLLDKFKQLTERLVGTKDSPVTFTDSNLPSDIAWTAITSYGGYSAVQSTSNPDVDWESFQDWSLTFSSDSLFMNGHIEGLKASEVLARIARHSQSAIYVEQNKLTFHRFSAADSNQTTFDGEVLLGPSILEIDDEDIVNRQYVYAGYNVSSKDWGIQVVSEKTSSINSYGAREHIEKDNAIWYVQSVAATNLAGRLIQTAGEPYDRLTQRVALPGVVRQIGETIILSDPFFLGGIDGGYRIMGYQLDMNTGTYTAKLDRSQYSSPFILDVSTLDGSDFLL